MMYVYASLLLHKAGKEINEESIKKVLEAAGVKVDEARAKALVAALEGVNIEEAIEKAAMAQVAAAVPVSSGEHKRDAKADAGKKAEEEKKSEEQAAAGLGALFG